jgi:hypothetical protein
MAVDLADYATLKNDKDYLDFIMHLLSARSCLFVGFSFLDPAFTHLLGLYEERFRPTFGSLHAALVPIGQQALVRRLAQLNIEVLPYDSSDEHACLWRAVRESFDQRSRRPEGLTREPIRAELGAPAIHRFLAFAYAQMRAKPTAQPLVSTVQDGVVAAILAEHAEAAMSEMELSEGVASALKISREEAHEVVLNSLRRLEARDQLLRDGTSVVWGGGTTGDLDTHLDRLAQDVLDRMRVREGVLTTEADRAAARIVLEHVFMSRAWDVAAHFAGAASGWAPDLPQVVSRLVTAHSRDHAQSRSNALQRAVISLLTAPDRQESELLVHLGRAAFGVQLLLATPRQALFHRYALPERIYLDANVLMPAITSGHPLRPAYADTIKRLSEASSRADSKLSLAVGMQFLNEIISHRRLGIELVQRAHLEDPEKLAQHTQFYGSTNVNVFVGAYASFVGRGRKHISFSEFLRQVAPYGTEETLAEHLRGVEILTPKMDFREEHNSLFVHFFNRLRQVYEDSADAILRGKEAVLIEHEAQQLTQLHLDGEAGIRSLFVTADAKLRRALLSDPKLQYIAASTISHLGLVAVTDVFVGLEADTQSLARLIWGAPFTDHKRALFEYFVNLGLRRYEDGLAMEMQRTAEALAQEAAAEAEREDIPLSVKTPEEVARTAAFLDRYEDRFYQYWREAIEYRERHPG